MKKSCFSKSIYTGQEWWREDFYLKGILLGHFVHWQQLALAPYSQLITVWESQLSLVTSTWVHWLHFPFGEVLSFWEAGAEHSMSGWNSVRKCADTDSLFTWVKKTNTRHCMHYEFTAEILESVGRTCRCTNAPVSKDFSSFHMVLWECVTELSCSWKINPQVRTNIYLSAPVYIKISKDISGL